jgi:hypothetical protein
MGLVACGSRLNIKIFNLASELSIYHTSAKNKCPWGSRLYIKLAYGAF